MKNILRGILRNSTCILCALFFLNGCTSPGTTNNTEDEEVNKKISVAIDTIVIAQMQFTPSSLSVKTGDTIVWINKDLVDHDITSDKPGSFYSDTLHVGKTWKMAVKDSAGYHCSIHPTMLGRIMLK